MPDTYGIRDPNMDLVLPLYGGTMRGPLLLSGLPKAPEEAVSKEYVDNREAVIPLPSDWIDIPLKEPWEVINDQNLRGCTILGGYLAVIVGAVTPSSGVNSGDLITDMLPDKLRPLWTVNSWISQSNENNPNQLQNQLSSIRIYPQGSIMLVSQGGISIGGARRYLTFSTVYPIIH